MPLPLNNPKSISKITLPAFGRHSPFLCIVKPTNTSNKMNALDKITNGLPAPVGQIVNMAADAGLKAGCAIGQEISDWIDELFGHSNEG